MAATSSGGNNGVRTGSGAVTSQPTAGGSNGANSAAGQKVFIQRDYSLGTGVRFQTRFPPELDGKIDRQLFEDTVGEINTAFAEAEQLSCASYISGCLACLTGYLLLCCFETHYEKSLKKVSRSIYRRNERDWIPRGLLLGEPVERGLRVIEITVLNPTSKSVGT